MLKKIRRLLAFTLAFVMMFSMTAFAAEKETTIKLDNVEYSSAGPETRGPAPAVTSVNIEDAYINNGRVIVVVRIVGYGHNEIATWDGNKIGRASCRERV